MTRYLDDKARLQLHYLYTFIKLIKFDYTKLYRNLKATHFKVFPVPKRLTTHMKGRHYILFWIVITFLGPYTMSSMYSYNL